MSRFNARASFAGAPAFMLLGALFLGTTPAVSFTAGAGTFPPNCDPSKTTFDVWDDDDIIDDLLDLGLQATVVKVGGVVTGVTTGNLSLDCPDPPCNDVTGGSGSSGESTAEIMVKFTFRDANGNVIGEQWSGVKQTSCDC